MRSAPPIPALGPDLRFAVDGAHALRHSASPAIRLELRVSATEPSEIHSILLEAQVRISPRLRSYEEAEEERLADLFGPVSQWKSSMQGLLWTNASLYVPALTDSANVDLDLPVTYDFEVAAARYLAALEGGSIPLEVLFSGSVFYAGGDGRLQVVRIPLDREATYELPVTEWRAAIDRHFPDSAWVRMRREQFDRLYAYRSRRTLTSWEATVDSLLADAEQGER